MRGYRKVAMRSALVTLSSLIVLATLSIACDDAIPESPAQAVPTASESGADVQSASPGATMSERPRDPDRPPEGEASLSAAVYSYLDVRRAADLMLEILDEERAWCESQPEVTALRAMLEAHEPEDVWRSLLEPAMGQDLRVVEIVAEATAEARGIPMVELPPVFLVTRTSLRHYACLTEEVWEDIDESDWTVGRPASRLAYLLGQEVEGYGDLEQSWLSSTLFWGWYGEIEGADERDPGEDGIGQVVIVSGAPMPEVYAGVLSHELVHFLQDQWTGWKLHDWYRDAETTDQLEALRWVVEGDATLNELSSDGSPLYVLLAEIEWGPDSHAEVDLWYRAYEALAPQDAQNLFAAYDQGATILRLVREAEGQEAIDALLLDPPESTEQLIHVDKFFSQEQPISLTDLPRLQQELFPEGEWLEPVLDRMGEQWLHSLLASSSKFPAFARRASTGWGGDQMALWQSADGSREIVTWQVVFDNPTEHGEGVSGLRRWLFNHSADEAAPIHANVLGWDGPTGSARLITRPRAVWLVAANNAEIADEVADGIRTRMWTNYWRQP